MRYTALSREEITRAIEGGGRAGRIPVMFHFWIDPNAFAEDGRDQVRGLLAEYPEEVLTMPFAMPAIDRAPADEPSFRWNYRDANRKGVALDNSGVIVDWDGELAPLLADFPSADSAHLLPPAPPEDGRYRLGQWWYFFFERLWSLRGMEDALTDFHLNPGAIHALFRRLTGFYKRMLTRAKAELNLDGVFTSDDLGTQQTLFFRPEMFDEFFAPYYKEVIDHAHALGMHFWLHACGNIEPLIGRFIDLGVDVLHPIQKYAMDERRIAGEYGGRIAIWAGMDVQRIVPFGSIEDVRREVRFLIDTYDRADGRFLLTLGNGATPDIPPENLRALFDEAYRYKNSTFP